MAPVVKETAEAILALGMFTLKDGAWQREVREEDGTRFTVQAQVVGEVLNLTIYPRISMMQHHRRVSGGVYLEIATKVAEKCGSKIVQSSNIGECIENSDRLKLLGDYGAGQRLDWDAVCIGFQRAISGEQPDYEDEPIATG